MTECSKVKVGSKVCDRANLSGEVVAMYGDAAKVCWNNGTENWIAGAWIRLDLKNGAKVRSNIRITGVQ